MSETLDQARQLMAGARRVGFEPAPASPAMVAEIENVVSEAVKKAHAEFAARVAARIAADPPRAPWTGPETTGDDLKKRTVVEDAAARDAGERERRERAEGAELGRRVGERLVAAAHACRKRAAAAAAPGTGALGIVDAYDEADRLRALQKATPDFLSVARVREADERAAFLTAMAGVKAEPMYKADESTMLSPPTREEVVAASGDPAWSERLRDEAVARAIRQVPPRRRF